MPVIDRERLLNEPGIFAVFMAFRLGSDWDLLALHEHGKAGGEVARVLAEHKERLAFDFYPAHGLTAAADYFLRVHARDPLEIQEFLTQYRTTVLGKHSQPIETLLGVTKDRMYVTAETSAILNSELGAAVYNGPPPRFAIVIPVKKTAAWWAMPRAARLREIETHTEKALPYLFKVKRKLYYATGLADVDFITYFETADLTTFHELALALVGIGEFKYHARWGNPTLVGSIQDVQVGIDCLCRRNLPF